MTLQIVRDSALRSTEDGPHGSILNHEQRPLAEIVEA